MTEDKSHIACTLKAFARISHFLPTNFKVLDVGCGYGLLKKVFEYNGCEWHGLDIEPAFTGRPNITLAPMWQTPYADNTFDIVFVCHSFEHSEYPLQSLKEFIRICKHNGYIFMSTPVYCTRQLFKREDGHEDADHIFVLTNEQLIKLFHYLKQKEILSWQEIMDAKNDWYNSQVTFVIVQKGNK